jgi:hypothetical protein
MEMDDLHVDDKEGSGQTPVDLFTVEARAKGVGEEYAEALAVRLAAMGMTVWIKRKGEDE